MKYTRFLVSSTIVAMTNAHATIFSAYVDDVSQGVGNSAAGYIRSPPNNNPVKDLTSADLTCNVNNVATAKTIDVPAGSKVTLEWHHNSADASDDIIDPSHKGPVQVYVAPTSSNGAGDVWVKLAEAGYDGTKWAVDDLIANKGKHDVTIPAGLAPGEYLVRGEIIALHEADVAFTANSARGAQLYMECVQIKVTGSGTTTLPAGVAIPGAYSETDPGIVFNLYGSFTSYTIPGPAVWDGASGGSASASASSVASSTSAAPVVSSTVAAVASTSALASAASPIVSSSKTQVQVSSAAPVASETATTSITATSSSTKDSCKSKSTTPTTLQTVTVPSETAVSGADTVQKYGRCGGIGYSGATACVSGSTCTVQNPYYSQCV